MHITHEIDSVAGNLARWIQDREVSKNQAPAFINLAKNAASLYVCIADSAQSEYAGVLPNHAYSDVVRESAEALAEESGLLVLLQYETAGIAANGDMESTLLYAARILNRTEELLVEHRLFKQGVASEEPREVTLDEFLEQEDAPEETGRFARLMVG